MAYGVVFVPASSVPTDGNSNAKPADFATKFVVAFDVVPVISDAGGTVVIYKNSGLFKTLPITKTSTSVVVVGKTLEITHGITSFAQGESYSVAITDGAVTGLAAGALANGVFDFVVGDYVSPLLSSTAASFSPVKGAVSVMANLNGGAFSLTVPFDEAVTTPLVPGNKAVYIYKEDGTVVDIVKVSTLTAGNGLGTATITVPVAATAIFQENTKYYVSVDAGAFVDISTNKNAFGGLSTVTTWTFTTRDYSAPVISATVSDITTSAAKLNVTLTEKGKYFYILQTEATADPLTAAAVQAGGVAVNVTTANTVVTSNLALLGSTAYEVFVVSENAETPANLGSTIVKKTFSSIDATAPLSIARNLVNNSAKKTSGVYMVFNEQVKGGAGTLDLRLSSNDSYVKQISASDVTSRKITAAEVTANTFGAGRTVNDWVTVIDFGMTLPSKTDYYVVFPSGYIKDLSDNTFVGGVFGNPINKVDWPITSSDFELPTVAVAFATPTSLASDITITFNETVQKQLSTTVDWASVLALEVNNVAVPFTVTSPALAGNGSVIVIDPTPAALNSNTTYTVRLRANAVKDLSGNAIVTETLYNLTTGDLDAFVAQYGSSVGATATTNLVANSTMKIDFNKAVKVNTTGTTWADATATNLVPFITFKKGVDVKAFTVAYDAATFTVTITPNDPLVSNAGDYVVTLDGAKVKDAVGTLLSAAAGYVASQTYAIRDFEAPVVVLSNVGNVSSLANPTITITDANQSTISGVIGTAGLLDIVTFKENSSNGANLAFAAVYDNLTGVLTVTPTVPLAVGKTYYYGIGANLKDGNGNITTGKFATFTIVAGALAPTIVASTYTINGSAQTPVATKLVNIVPKTGNIVTVSVTFNDNIKEIKSVPTYNTISLTDGVTTWLADVTPTAVSGNTLTVNFSIPALAALVDAGKECTISLPAGIVQGSTAYTGTTFAQFAGTTILFDSKDLTAPTVSLNTPATTNVALNTALKLALNEKVVLGSGNILIKKGATTVQTIAINATNVTLDAAGTLATVVKTDLTDYNTAYTVEVPVGAFKDDVSLNSSVVNTFAFTTVVNPQPTATALSPVDNSDQLAISPLTLGLTMSEEVVKYDPLVGTRKLWYLVKEGALGIRASFNGSNDLVMNAGNDVVVANNYIETASVGISGNVVSISTGFTPVAGERYYVLITPGSFLDKSTGVTVGGNPIPGVFAGVTTATEWNFTTKDENPGTVTFVYTKRADDLVSVTSNITINFTRPIKKADGSVINDADVANLFVLTKTAGPVTGAAVKAFVGTISADKKTVTILNSSLVTLGEMTALSTYTIGMVSGSMIYQNSAAIAGAFDTFNTSDYTAPVVAASITSAIADVKKDEATIQFAATDNVNLNTLYYTIQAGDNTTAAPAAAVVKADKSQAITGVADAKSYKFTGLAEKTSYVVWTVAVDKAGNESAVSKVVFKTDDATKPLMATLPTNFVGGTLTFIFNEAVTPANNSVRILDATSMTLLATLNLLADPSATPNAKLLVTSAFAPATTNALVNYYVEIDKGLVGDVPVVAGDAVNYFDGLFRTDLMVTSKDVTAPTLSSTTPVLPATDVDLNFNIKLTFSEAVKKATTLPVNAFYVEKWNGTAYEAFEVVDPANVVTNGTSDVILTVSRTLASTTLYRVSVNLASFTDLSGNVATGGVITNTITTKDVVAPTVVFAPAKNATGVLITTTSVSLTFNEAIRLLDNSAIDSYDLDSLVYFKKDVTPVAFSAVIDGTNKVITITPAAALVKDATYTFGFKAKFEDVSNNATAADAATFRTETTTIAAQYLSWTPAKNTTTAPWLGTAAPITLNFTSPVFTLSSVAANNNLPITAAYLANTALAVYKDGVQITDLTTLIFTVVDNKTFTVAPKTNWGSSSVIKVEVVGGTLQLNEGNVVQLTGTPFDASTYKAQDIIAPTVVTYVPAKVGLAGVSPVIPKTSTLQLIFNEDVKVSTGIYEIHRWDGVLVASGNVTVADDKRTATLGSLSGLPTNQEYYAIVNAGVVVDVTDNNAYAGLTDIKAWKFILKDDAIPQIVAYLPTTDNQPVTTKLTINLDRPVVLTGAGYVALYKSAAGGDAIQIWRGADNGTTGAFSVSGNTVTVNILPLDVNTKYFVELSANTFGSAADNSKVQAGVARADWSFTTEVNANPTLVAQVPANNANGILLDQDLQMTFNMPVEAGSGSIQLHAVDGSLVLNFDVKGADVTFANEVVSVALPKLAEGKQFYVIIPATAIRNKTFTPEYFGGITVPYDWKFNTGDFTAPTVAANPANGNAMPLTFNVTLTFNEKVTGVSATTLTVSKGTINSVSNEATGTIYVANITAPSLADVILTVPATVKDVAGNALVITKFTYKVDNFDAPKLISWTPADGSKGIKKDTALVMTFDKPIVAGTGKISIYNSLLQLFKSYTLTAANIVGNVVTVPVTGLPDATTFVVDFEANTVKDLLGLPVAALTDPTVWNFETGDNSAPTVVSVTPAINNNATSTFDVTILFSEDVVNAASFITVTGGTVTVAGTGKSYVATITGEDAAVIKLTIAAGVPDVSLRNKLAVAVVKTFTIGDNTAPTLVVTAPEAPVATRFTVGLTFSEKVSGVADAITVTGGKLEDVTGSGASYILTVSAKEQTAVTIVLANTIKDVSPLTNKFAGQTLTYTTGDFTAPQLVSWTPFDVTLADNYPTFKMTFNENVALGAGGKLKVYKVATTTAVLSIPVTAAMINGKEVTVSYTYDPATGGLDKNARYYVLVEGSALTDVAGNKFAGVSDAAVWTFKTGAAWITKVDPNISLEFKVYPNPFVDVINLVSPSQLSKVVITNIAGQVVKEVVNPANSIQLNELRSGIYIISLYDMDNVVAKTAKIVKR
jgi:hypothetical protein